MIMSILSIILPVASLPVVYAAPWERIYVRQRGDNNDSTGFSPAIWIPIVAVGGFFFFGGLFLFRKKLLEQRNRRTAPSGNVLSSGTNATTTSQTRELTAEELTGGTRPSTTTRRPRRPRRTPSQVSTRSLPAYMKEPGDHEVVIYRGLEDMEEDAEGENPSANNSMTTTAEMTMNSEGTDRNPNDVTPLLPPRTDSPGSIRPSVNLSRGSYDHQGSDESHARLIDLRRGEAPAYETIDLGVAAEPVPIHHRQNSQSARISGFFSRLMPHRTNNGTTDEPAALPPPNAQISNSSHTPEPSAQSGALAQASADSPRSRGGRTHRDRNNNSSTGSVFTILSRTLSRTPDDGPLTSPSMISLNSISPPLTHTATRTEFTYPRTGPTSQQVKFLSSKETFGRFGLPYGPDAVAFAASSSRQELPPDFDSIHQLGSSDLSPNPNGGSTFSLRRSTSTRRLSNGNSSHRGESPLPESAEPSPDPASLTDPPSQLPLAKRESTPNLEADVLTLPLQSSLSKQKSTPNLGMGHPPMSKSALKSKSMANLQNDGDGSFPPRSVSATGSFLTVESFQTAHDDEDGFVSPPLTGTLGPVPQIMVQLPSNNPSLTNLPENGSGSETEEYFDGDEDVEDSDSDGDGVNGGGDKTPRAASMNEVRGDDQSGSNDEDDDESSASESNPKGSQDARTRASTSPSPSDSESGSDDESEVETHSNHTEADKTLVTDLETSQMRHIHEGTDVTLTPETVAAKLKTSSPDFTKTSEKMSRTTAIGA